MPGRRRPSLLLSLFIGWFLAYLHLLENPIFEAAEENLHQFRIEL